MQVSLDIINLLIAMLAIGLSIFAMIKSKEWSDKAERNLEKAQSTLEEVRKTSDQIDRNIQVKLDDMLKRALPSGEETAMTGVMSQVMPQIFTKLMEDPKTLMKIMDQQSKK